MKKLFLFALALAMTANVFAQFNPQTTPLTMEARDANTQVKVLNRSAGAFEYQINGQGTRQSIAAGPDTVTIDLPNVGDYLQLWGNQATTCPADWTFSHIGVASGFVYVYGNVMSMVQNGASDFANLTTLQGTWTFCNLFQNDRNLDIHPTKDLVLPATNLTQSCYRQMFYGCRELTRVPTLPATSMVDYCYYGMFYGCKGLTQAPALPATILADYCYGQMFSSCSNLTQAPVLPATSLATTCYYQMFRYCYALNRVVCYATEIGTNSTMNWLQNVAATGTFVKAEGFNGWELNSVNGIPSGWTVEESAGPGIITQKPADPVISNTTGYIIDTASIALSCATEGASIYYTLDGSVPSATNGTLYATPIVVNVTSANESSSITLKAIAIKEDVSSEIASQAYSLRRTTCTFGVSYNNAAFGSISLPESAKYGDEVNITVNPAEGYVLDYINIPEGSIGNLTENKFVVPAHVGLVHLYVYFKKATLTVTVNAGEHGSVNATTVDGLPVDLTTPLTYGQKIYLNAVPDEGYEVDEWTNYNPATGLTVTTPVTVTVTFKKKSYHVTFVDYDNITILKEEDVLYQESATAPADPTREGYTFAGWDKDFSSITAATTIKATYTVNSYMVTVVAEHGTVTAKDVENNPRDLSQPVEYGTVLLLTATPDANWLFDHWENYNYTTGLTVTGNITVTAVFKKQSYTVTFMDYDNTVLKEEEVAHGESATAPADPTREGYTFAGWDKDFSNITDYTIVKATYTKNTYVVTIVAEHGTVDATDGDNNPIDLSQPIEYGKVIWLIANPDEGYELENWTNYNPVTGLTVMENVTVTATFKQTMYHVIFVDYDDTVLKEEDVLYKATATAPADPTREGYTFTGWNQDFSSVTSNITVKATYTINMYSVTVISEHGVVSAKDSENNPVILNQPMEYGTRIWLEVTPDEHWLFDHWDGYNAETGLTVTDNITVTAVFVPNTEGIENIISGENATKVLIDGQIYILRGEKFYTLQGAEVK